jgi:putative DNA primase/helicase
VRHNRDDVLEMAKGRWRGILLAVGLPERALGGKHGPCPLCEGADRFRFDDKGGRGTSICSQCGSRDGIGLVKDFLGLDFLGALDRVRELVGGVKPETPRPEMTEEQRRAMLRDLWTASRTVEPGDVVDRYLTARGVGEKVYPAALRTCDRCRFESDRHAPAMLAVVSDQDGKAVMLHRTFLEPDGRKLDVPEPRKLTPGKVPPGSAIRLSDPNPILGIAEGIETALAASARFDVPVWAAISSGLLMQWEPPQGTEEVLVFGDNDPKFGGQKAAFSLAHRLAIKPNAPTVRVLLPPDAGKDWADYVGQGL